MRKLRKLSLVLPVIGIFAAALAVSSATQANAQAIPNIPSNCSTILLSGYTEGGAAQCFSGTGHFRVLIYCTANPQNGYGTYYPGPWQPTGQGVNSTEYCPSSQPYIVAAGYDLALW